MITLRDSRPVHVDIAIDADDSQLANIHEIILALVVIAGAILTISRGIVAVVVFCGDVVEAGRMVGRDVGRILRVNWPIATG